MVDFLSYFSLNMPGIELSDEALFFNRLVNRDVGKHWRESQANIFHFQGGYPGMKKDDFAGLWPNIWNTTHCKTQ